MERTDFERQINAVVPRPDPETTAALFAFGQELGQERECDGAQDLLNSLRFIARHFNVEIMQGVYEIIRYGAVLPGEMVAAALLMWNNFTPQQAAKLADEGCLMHFYWPGNKDESSPLAVCVIKEKDRSRTCHTVRFGQFDPEAALQAAQQYARDLEISVTDALLSLTVDMELKPDDVADKILVSETPETSALLASTFFRCAAMAARLTFDADQNRVEVEYNPLWLGLRRHKKSAQGEMTQTMQRSTRGGQSRCGAAPALIPPLSATARPRVAAAPVRVASTPHPTAAPPCGDCVAEPDSSPIPRNHR